MHIEIRDGIKQPAGPKAWAAWRVIAQCIAAGVRDRKAIIARGVAEGNNEGQMGTELPRYQKFWGVAI